MLRCVAEHGPQCLMAIQLLKEETKIPGIDDKLEFLKQKYLEDEDFKRTIDNLDIKGDIDSLDDMIGACRKLSEEKCEIIKVKLEELFDFKAIDLTN
ncbi:UNKNOWN [Stylonychia lemnae]|uniref:Uncharacterized protein n=1 Tax=Stylonychia lemnae TaxID=5949 RepID=A0A077ZYP3_STYLE|nr:UNKNOWN [Stylonychia lemnae]|eukprot:CDW74732.1 UNKNOWN [Stylonychia lemnae]